MFVCALIVFLPCLFQILIWLSLRKSFASYTILHPCPLFNQSPLIRFKKLISKNCFILPFFCCVVVIIHPFCVVVFTYSSPFAWFFKTFLIHALSFPAANNKWCFSLVFFFLGNGWLSNDDATVSRRCRDRANSADASGQQELVRVRIITQDVLFLFI